MAGNANVIAEQLHNERDLLREGMKRYLSKVTKEIMLKRIRQIERELDIPGENYNGGNW